MHADRLTLQRREMTKAQKSSQSGKPEKGMIKHDMPLMHFWQSFGGTLARQNALLTD